MIGFVYLNSIRNIWSSRRNILEKRKSFFESIVPKLKKLTLRRRNSLWPNLPPSKIKSLAVLKLSNPASNSKKMMPLRTVFNLDKRTF